MVDLKFEVRGPQPSPSSGIGPGARPASVPLESRRSDTARACRGRRARPTVITLCYSRLVFKAVPTRVDDLRAAAALCVLKGVRPLRAVSQWCRSRRRRLAGATHLRDVAGAGAGAMSRPSNPVAVRVVLGIVGVASQWSGEGVAVGVVAVIVATHASSLSQTAYRCRWCVARTGVEVAANAAAVGVARHRRLAHVAVARSSPSLSSSTSSSRDHVVACAVEVGVFGSVVAVAEVVAIGNAVSVRPKRASASGQRPRRDAVPVAVTPVHVNAIDKWRRQIPSRSAPRTRSPPLLAGSTNQPRDLSGRGRQNVLGEAGAEQFVRPEARRRNRRSSPQYTGELAVDPHFPWSFGDGRVVLSSITTEDVVASSTVTVVRNRKVPAYPTQDTPQCWVRDQSNGRPPRIRQGDRAV